MSTTAQTISIQGAPPAYPVQPLHHLDTLWIQVAGTLCNLTCTHCFVPSGPGIRRHDLLSRERVRELVRDGLALGVREVYFTGGEPFLHPEIMEMMEDTLALAPLTVLTNGTLFTRARTERLATLSSGGFYSLELRVSLDGPTAAVHDRIRGQGTFARALEGLGRLSRAGLVPIVTATLTDGEDAAGANERYVELLSAAGVARPRLKLLPLFKLGREVERTGPYAPHETLAGMGDAPFDTERLQCGHCRAVTSRGVFVCPLLVDEPGARMGDSLGESLGPFALRHGACSTCYATGMTCANG